MPGQPCRGDRKEMQQDSKTTRSPSAPRSLGSSLTCARGQQHGLEQEGPARQGRIHETGRRTGKDLWKEDGVVRESSGEMTFTIRNRRSELRQVAERLAEFGRRHRVPSSVTRDFDLALDELITNIITHGYGEGDGDHEIGIRIEVADNVLTVRIKDDARAFDPLAAPPPDLDTAIEHRPIGGLGVHFVRTVMDRVAYERRDDRNLLTISRAFGERGAS